MKDYLAHAPKEFDYAAFIEDIAPLIAQAKAFGVGDRRQDGDVFRAWRHKVEDLLVKIKRTHVDVSCDLDQRQFRVMSYSSVSAKDQLSAFDRDLRDTLVELDHIVSWYEKYGEPKLRRGSFQQAAKASPEAVVAVVAPPIKPADPEWPQKEKLTLHWLFTNMPASAWAWLALFVGGAFTLGVTVGNWPSVQKKLDQWSEPATTPKTVPAPSKAASK